MVLRELVKSKVLVTYVLSCGGGSRDATSPNRASVFSKATILSMIFRMLFWAASMYEPMEAVQSTTNTRSSSSGWGCVPGRCVAAGVEGSVVVAVGVASVGVEGSVAVGVASVAGTSSAGFGVELLFAFPILFDSVLLLA